jgi:hypothetical protein
MRSFHLLTVGLLTLTAGALAAQQERPHGDAVKAILKLADGLEAADVPEQARKIVKDYDSCDISQVFRARRYGGAGIGTAADLSGIPKNNSANSIEALVRVWAGKKPPTQADLEKHQADLLKTARVLQAMAELAPYRLPHPYMKNEKKVQEWARIAQDFKAQTRELREGIQEKDATRVRATMLRLNDTCTNCHNVAF